MLEHWTATYKRIKLDYFLTPYTTVNSKWLKHLNVIPEIIKLLGENIGSTLFDISLSNIILDMPPQARKIKVKIKNWDLIKLRSFCTMKETINKMKKESTEWEKIFANDITNKVLISKIYKELR